MHIGVGVKCFFSDGKGVMLSGKRKALSGGGMSVGVAMLCSSGLVALSSVAYFFDGWGNFPSTVFYVCLLCSAILGGFLAFYAEKKYNPESNYVFKCAIFGVIGMTRKIRTPSHTKK